MNPIRAATLSVRDIDAAIDRFGSWLYYHLIDRGIVSAEFAATFDAPAIAGARQAILWPASGRTPIFVSSTVRPRRDPR